ncbi:putative reverse transcriptase domain-containing protein, partial [Tanacetum coccineum]
MVAAMEPMTIQSVILKAGVLTDEAIRNGSLNKNTKKRGNGRESVRYGNVKDDNKRFKTGMEFATTTNPVRKKSLCQGLQGGAKNGEPTECQKPDSSSWACFKYGGTDHYKATCLRFNRALRQGENHPNQAFAIDGGQGRGNNGNLARGRAFMMGTEKAFQDPNIVTVAFTLNNHYATTLFDSGADYSFVSTTFMPLLDIEPNNLGFSYEIEIASRQLVEINKVIRGCKLEIEGHTFDIDLISFGHGSFDIISLRRTARREGEISRLTPSREIEFRIDLIPGAMLVANSPYRLAPSKMEELSSQLRELQDKGFIRLSSSLWGAPLQEVQFLGHVINGDDIHVDPSKIESVKNWEAPRTPLEEMAFQTLKDKLCNVPILALPDGPEDFVDEEQLFNDYDCEIRYHPGKSSIKDKILATQNEAFEVVNALAKMLQGLDEQMEHRSNGTLYYLDRIWVPLMGDVRTLIMDEAYKLKYYVHPGANKLYY